MDELARLIASLTKSEKRSFKLFTSLQGGEKSYMKLFDAIEEMNEYDEEKLKKMFRDEDFIKRLPAVKHYLYAQIMKSLRINYSGNTVHSQLKEMIEDVSILYEKRLYRQCSKIIEKAKDLARQNENILELIEINVWEQKVLMEMLTLDKYENTLDSSYEEERRLVRLQANILEYRNLYNRMVLINKKIKEARTDEELSSFKEVINHPLMQSVNSAITFDSKYFFYQIHLLYNHAKGDNETSLEIVRRQMNLLEQYPQKIGETPKIYVNTLNNLLMCQIHTHDYTDFEKTLAKLRALPLKSQSIEVNRFMTSYSFEMVMYLDKGEFTASAAIRQDIINGLEKYSGKINAIEEITMLYNLFYSYFGTGEFQKALKILNQLLNDYQKDLRYDVQSSVRILNLILHFELNNRELLEYNAVSAYRFLSKSKRLYQLEKVVLDFIRRKMNNIHSEKDQREAFILLRESLRGLAVHPYEKKAFEYFDYISWLEAHIENRPFEEVVKEKFKLKNKKPAN